MPLFVGTRRILRPAPSSAAASPQTTWNSADKAASITLSGSDRIATAGAAAPTYVRSVAGKSSGKWYAEAIATFASGIGDDLFGVADSTTSLTAYPDDSTGWTFKYLNFNAVVGNGNAGSFPTYGSASSSGDTVMLAIDFTNDKLWFGANGTWYESGNPATNTGGLNLPSGTIYLAGGSNASGDSINLPATQTYTPPSGFSVWS